MEKINQLVLLNKAQVREAQEWLRIYKKVFICCQCGNLYGSDNLEPNPICVFCENKLHKKKVCISEPEKGTGDII
jgi:hypothetical protein